MKLKYISILVVLSFGLVLWLESQPINVPGGAGGGNIGLNSWSITTPYSQYESPARGLVISSGGKSSSISDGVTGDGYVQISSNLAGSNSCWLDYRGNIYAAVTNDWNHKAPILKSLIAGNNNTLATYFGVWIGGSTNIPNYLRVDTHGSHASVGLFYHTGTSPTNYGAVSGTNVTLGGTLFSSTTPTAIAGNTAGETNLIGPATIPAFGLTNDQDSVEFYTSCRVAVTPASKLIKVYFGSSVIYSSGSFANSNSLLTIQGRIINQNTSGNGTNQYVIGSAYWTGLGGNTAPPYAVTNWSLTTGETNWLDTQLVVAVTNSVANVITNECLQVKIHPAGPYTF